jgi:hypothetical protein
VSPKPSFQLDHFEQMPATAATLLLRVGGRGRSKAPALLVDDGQDVRRIEPLPGPPVPSGEVRAAFSLPVEAVRQAATFALDLGGGRVVSLPDPQDRVARTGRADEVVAELERERARSAQLELALLAARGEIDELRRAGEETSERITVLEAAALAAEREDASTLRAEASRLREALAEADQARDDLSTRVHALEAQLAEAERQTELSTADLGAALADVQRVTAERNAHAAAIQSAVDERNAHADTARRRAAERDEHAAIAERLAAERDEHAAVAQTLTAERDDRAEEVRRLTEDLRQLDAELARLSGEHDDRLAEIERLVAEGHAQGERAAELDQDLQRLAGERDEQASRVARLTEELHRATTSQPGAAASNGQPTEELATPGEHHNGPAVKRKQQAVAASSTAVAPARTTAMVHRELPLTTVGHRHRVSAQPRRRPVRLRSESRWLPAEWVFGLLLLLVAAGAAVLVLSGTIHIPGAP